jgi:hypothetical protein
VRELSPAVREQTPVLIPTPPTRLLSVPGREDRPQTPLTRETDSGDRSRFRSPYVVGGSASDIDGSRRRPPLPWAVRGGHPEATRTSVREAAVAGLPDDGTDAGGRRRRAGTVGDSSLPFGR